MGYPLKFQYVEVAADTPREMGFQYGEQAREKILAGIADYKELFAETSGDKWEDLVRYAETFIPVAEKYTPDVMEEVRGIAEGCGAALGDIMLLNCRYELTKFPSAKAGEADKECTSFALLGEATADGNPYTGQNWDYRAGILDHVVILHMKQGDGLRILGLAEAGQVVRNGFSSRGIGLNSNNLQSVHDRKGTGVPVIFLRRTALSARNFTEARNLIETMPRDMSCNFMLGSVEGFAVDLEGYPGGADRIEPIKGVVTHANHFEVDPAKETQETSQRSLRLRELLMQKHGQIDVPHIKYCLSDHKNYPQALCRHPADVSLPLAQRSITVASVIYDLARGVGHICAGPPCEGEFVEYRL